MATILLSKQDFINFIVKQVADDDVVLFSGDLVGNMSVSRKTNQKKVTFSYAADAFKDEGIGHFLSQQTKVGSFCFSKREYLSDGCLKQLDEYQKEKKKVVIKIMEVCPNPECENPSFHAYEDGSKYCEDCGNTW